MRAGEAAVLAAVVLFGSSKTSREVSRSDCVPISHQCSTELFDRVLLILKETSSGCWSGRLLAVRALPSGVPSWLDDR